MLSHLIDGSSFGAPRSSRSKPSMVDGGTADGTATLDLARALQGLKPAFAEVVTLRFLHGLSLQETALALQTTVDAVKSRQARALDELRKTLLG
jgi:RNA polymerase sigma-70 factor (ECF subfamily)